MTLVVDRSSVRDVSPDGAVLTLHEVAGIDLQDVVGTFCCFVHFFPTEQAASAWADRSPGTYVVSVSDGFEYPRIYNRQLYGAALAGAADNTDIEGT